MARSIEVRVDSENATRLHISKKTRKKAKGAVWQAIQALNLAAAMVQGVPYLGAISTALTAFMKIQDEVSICKDECRAAMDYARQIYTLLEKFRDDCLASGRGESLFTESLCSVFSNLESIVLHNIEVLLECRLDSAKLLDRVRIYYKHSELASAVKDCSTRMQRALQLFNTSLQVDQIFLLEDIRLAVHEMCGTMQSMTLSQSATLGNTSRWLLRTAPSIFNGREFEVTRAVRLIIKHAPARIAVIGPGGIGKTSIALAVMNAPEVSDLYGYNRCFMSCEAITTADGIVRALADATGLVIKKDMAAESAQHSLVNYLRTTPGIVCLDNLETPLDADRSAVEALFNEFAALPSTALLVTSRDTSMPTIKWTMPSLEHIKPFSLTAALRTWDDICQGHDEYTVKLIEAVDRMPLAVNVLARLAIGEQGSKSIWARWQSERTDLIRAGREDHKLYNVAVSVELSLRTLDLPGVKDVLSFICIFPGGLNDYEMDILKESTHDMLPVRQALALLKQYSLVYAEDLHSPQVFSCNNPYIRVLSPIRHYMLKHHRIADNVFLSISDVIPELYPDNINAYVGDGFKRGQQCRDCCLRIVEKDVGVLRDFETTCKVIDMAHEVQSASLPAMYRRLSRILEYRNEFEKARSYFIRSIEMDEQSQADWETLLEDYMHFYYMHLREPQKHQLESRHLDAVENVFEKAQSLLDIRQIPDDDIGMYDPLIIRNWVYAERLRLRNSQDK